MQNNEEILLRCARVDSVQLHHLKNPKDNKKKDEANSERRNLSINI